MSFKTTREVHYNGKRYAAGKSIPVADDEEAREQLLGLQAIVADKATSQPAAATATADMPKAQLLKMAAKAKVTVAKKDDGTEVPLADATEAQIALAINSAAKA